MYQLRSWSMRNAHWLKAVYHFTQTVLTFLNPLLKRIGHQRLDKSFLRLEKLTKGPLLDSQHCGQCIVQFTGMVCPMNCPKEMRNGPCGGVRPDNKCEVRPEMDCVWVLAWEGNRRSNDLEYPMQFLQPPVDHRLIGTSAWLRELRRKDNATADNHAVR